MISHFNLGTNNLDASEAFYNELLKFFDAKQLYKAERTIFYSLGDSRVKLCINKPFNGEPATAGNGSMVGLSMASKEEVNDIYARALELGGTSEGEPGDRADGVVYAAYFRDLDGNKFGVFYAPNSFIG